MSLTACRECEQQISTEAKACPHCGAKGQGPQYPIDDPDTRRGCAAVAILGLLVIVGYVGYLAYSVWFG